MSKTISFIETKLVDAGVNNLKQFGYPSVDKENILTDEVYWAFFEEMLKSNMGHSNDVDQAINNIINRQNSSK